MFKIHKQLKKTKELNQHISASRGLATPDMWQWTVYAQMTVDTLCHPFYKEASLVICNLSIVMDYIFE